MKIQITFVKDGELLRSFDATPTRLAACADEYGLDLEQLQADVDKQSKGVRSIWIDLNVYQKVDTNDQTDAKADLVKAATELRTARRRENAAMDDVRAAVVNADTLGVPRKVIADLAGVSRQTVYTILNEEGR